MFTARLAYRWALWALVMLATAGKDFAGPGTSRTSLLPLDLAGRPVDPLKLAGSKASVLVFVRTDCPVSNRYAPEIQRLYQEFSPKGVEFWLVFVDPQESPGVIRDHVREYGFRAPVLRDPQHVLVQKTGVQVTPEVAVFALRPSGAQMVYRGRIDNWYVSFGKSRVAPTTHDLERTLEAILEGKPVALRITRAVGCFISDLQ